MPRLQPRSTLFPYTTLFRSLLARVDFVTLHVPLSPATRHLIGARELRQMKRGAYLINARDRKSTRLNSSHVEISYAVFCLKKKNNKIERSVNWMVTLPGGAM